jgi:hypothetical protein
LDYVWFGLGALRLPSQFILPLRNLLKLIEKEDAPTLTLTNWFHDPYAAGSFEFFDEYAVFSRQVISGREEIIRI